MDQTKATTSSSVDVKGKQPETPQQTTNSTSKDLVNENHNPSTEVQASSSQSLPFPPTPDIPGDHEPESSDFIDDIPTNNEVDLLDYDLLQGIVDGYNEFLINSVRNCFEVLVEIVTGFQFACVYHDVLSFHYSGNEILSLNRVTFARHVRIQEHLYDIKTNKFINRIIMYLRVLKELLEEEKDDFLKYNRQNNAVRLSLGTLEDTKLFMSRIKNLLRNGKHLKYSPMTWYDRVTSLFDDLNRLDEDSSIHFMVQRYGHRDFEDYPLFLRYRLLNEDETID